MARANDMVRSSGRRHRVGPEFLVESIRSVHRAWACACRWRTTWSNARSNNEMPMPCLSASPRPTEPMPGLPGSRAAYFTRYIQKPARQAGRCANRTRLAGPVGPANPVGDRRTAHGLAGGQRRDWSLAKDVAGRWASADVNEVQMDHDEMSQAGGREARSATSSDVADRRMAPSAGALGLGAVALGACALGATAIGALAIGRLAVGALALRRGRVRSLTVDSLEVRRLHVGELTIASRVPR